MGYDAGPVTFLLTFLYLCSFMVVSVAFLAGLVTHQRARTAVGQAIVVHGSRRRRRLQLLAFLGLVFVGCLIVSAEGQGPFAVGAIVGVFGAIALTFLPVEGEGWIGTGGVRLGWLVVPWSNVESWRLVGDHLRFKKHERWNAIPVTEPEKQLLREVLTKVAPEKEAELS